LKWRNLHYKRTFKDFRSRSLQNMWKESESKFLLYIGTK